MLVALVAHDKPGALEIRKANRSAHLEHLKSQPDIIAQAGALLGAGGEMIGSLIIFDVPDMETAQAWADNDPYAKAGLFAEVTLSAWNRVVG